MANAAAGEAIAEPSIKHARVLQFHKLNGYVALDRLWERRHEYVRTAIETTLQAKP